MCCFTMFSTVMFTFLHVGELWDHSLPVHNVQGVEVSKCTSNFSSIEPRSGLEEDPLSLEMVKQLKERKTTQKIHQQTSADCSLYLPDVRFLTYLSTVNVVQHKVQFVSSLEGVVEPHQEGMLDVFHQHAALSHDMLLLRGELEDTFRVLFITVTSEG